MILVAAMFLLVPVGLALYLYVNGAFPTFSLRPYRFAFYILLLYFFALSVGVGFIQLCCAVL